MDRLPKIKTKETLFSKLMCAVTIVILVLLAISFAIGLLDLCLTVNYL